MAKIISFILIFTLLTNCQSQQKNQVQQNKVPQINNIEYFLGSWVFVEKNYMDGVEKKLYPLQECMKKYSLLFEKQNGKIFLTKNYATGKDCVVKSSSGKIPIVVNESSFSYLDVDLKRVDHYKILSRDKFSIVYNDILDGKVREIEDVYQKQ